MVSGRMTCPRCSEGFAYTCDLELGATTRGAGGLLIDVTSRNIRHGHICKAPEPQPIAA